MVDSEIKLILFDDSINGNRQKIIEINSKLVIEREKKDFFASSYSSNWKKTKKKLLDALKKITEIFNKTSIFFNC